VSPIVSPAEEYRRRLDLRNAQISRVDQLHERVGYARLSLGIVILVIAWFALWRHAIPAFWVWAAVAALVGVIIYHRSVRLGRARSARAAAFYRSRLARIEDTWAGSGSRGERFEDAHHVYSADLDLFGKGSVFELLSMANTRMGEDRLASWLLAPAPLETLRERHACISDLRERLDLREDLAVLADQPTAGVHPHALVSWAAAPNELDAGWIRAVAIALPLLALGGAIVWNVFGLATPLVAILIIEAIVVRALKERCERVIYGTENAFADLKMFSRVLLRLESESFSAEALRALIQKLSSHSRLASKTVAGLSTVVSFVEARRNPILSVLEVPLLYSIQAALIAERWRRANGAAVKAWVDVVGECEALISLAAYSYEHPADTVPEFVTGAACFEARSAGHPLLPAARAVRNDVSVCAPTRVLLVSGSNMSGKSTLLRTVGINAVLAMAGAPVRCSSLRLTPVQVGASIRINDSLHEGSSRFYAEITRLKQLYSLSEGDLPLLFLLDELLQGTNSADRRIGAEGIVRALVERKAVGLVSTHDLALTDLQGLASDALRNVHFQDELEGHVMKFDFTLREGVVTRSNGVQLMRSIGLKV
jgi:hypothetical protein